MKFNNKMGEKVTFPQNGDLNDNENENEEDMEQDEIDDDDDEEDELGDMSQEEFNALNHKMDELNTALDTIEQKNDVIYSELLKLLQANREIRQQMESQCADEPSKSSAK